MNIATLMSLAGAMLMPQYGTGASSLKLLTKSTVSISCYYAIGIPLLGSVQHLGNIVHYCPVPAMKKRSILKTSAT